MQDYKKDIFGNLLARKNQLLEEIQKIDGKEEVENLDVGDRASRKNLQEHLCRVLFQEDIKWKQRSRTKWLGAGDRNTKFFHAVASARRQVN